MAWAALDFLGTLQKHEYLEAEVKTEGKHVIIICVIYGRENVALALAMEFWWPLVFPSLQLGRVDSKLLIGSFRFQTVKETCEDKTYV